MDAQSFSDVLAKALSLEEPREWEVIEGHCDHCGGKDSSGGTF